MESTREPRAVRLAAMEQPVPDLEGLRQRSRGDLACPACGRLIALVGRRTTMRHPFAQMLEDQSFRITGWWSLLLLCALVASVTVGGLPLIGRGLGWGLVFMPLLPGVLIWFLVRLFPTYRVTACPHCGFKEIQRLEVPKRAEIED
jgi:DNA-directed RNA polymerase subunit RPC12/RpoP